MSASRDFKSAIYDQLARVGKAVASPRRLELLDLLTQGPRTVEVLARLASLSIANTSQHLQVLRAARLVEAEKQGLHVTYRAATDDVGAFLLALRQLAESRLLEIEDVTRQYLEERDALEQVDQEALIERVRRGEVTVLDVRPIEEYRAGHIPGALSVPLRDLERRVAALPRDKEIVAYCRGPYCVLSIEAMQALRERGFEATRLEDGVYDWRARGLTIDRVDDAQERSSP